jgi:hypothetical protein
MSSTGRLRQLRAAHSIPSVNPPHEEALVRKVVNRQNEEALGRMVNDHQQEEAMARDVEARVIAAAAQQQGAGQASGFEHGGETSPATPAWKRSWGGLPAPWEPLPDWLTSPEPASPALVGDARPGSVQFSRPTAAAAPPPAPNGSHVVTDLSGAAASLAMYAAEHDRDLPTADTSTPAPDHPAPNSVEPDLDALARQVYAVLKRRLLAERQRFG